MTKINYTPQLDYNNVLIRPKRSTLSSRSEVYLEREIKFRCGKSWTGTIQKCKYGYNWYI